MADIRLTRKEEKGKLPAVCMCCGEPATERVERSFPLHPPHVAGPSGVAEVRAVQTLFALANTPTIKLPTSFCARHRHYWLLRSLLTWGGLAGLLAVILGGLVTVVLLITVARIDAPWLSCCAVVPFLAYMIAWIVPTVLVQKRTIRAQLAEDGSDAVVLRNVDEQYVEALLRQRAAASGNAPPATENPGG